MRDQRSGSQILYGLLPEQTADLKGGIWKTVEWKNPITIDVEDSLVRRRLIDEMQGWVNGGLDPSAVNALLAGDHIEVVSVNRNQGVKVERFPEIWVCRLCRRVETGKPKKCRGGHDRWEQLHFVGYHECGRLETPFVPRCREHNDVRMRHQSSMDASRIIFDCPVCEKVIQRGLGNRTCPCGRAYSEHKNAKLLTFNVHRAAVVYSPQTFMLINPPSREKMRRITESGGPRRALTWALGGFVGSPEMLRPTESSIVDDLEAKGIPRELAEKMAALASSEGHLAPEEDIGELAQASGPMIEAAQREAVDIALATSDSHTRISDLITPETPEKTRLLFSGDYPVAVQRAGLAAVDLVDRFPVLKAVYGFTRGGMVPGSARLSRFHGKGGGYRVYADLQQAEALMFRLDPTEVYEWLRYRGHALPTVHNERETRATIAARAGIPSRFDEPTDKASIGQDLLTLTHSYAHRVVRQLAVFAGVDREGLGEYLVPRHCTFFVFAATRGDFVLGGLQAVFENDLHSFLSAVVTAESRCPLDPACSRNNGACHACMHLGEPVCDHFNRYLDRKVLFGPDGFLAAQRLRSAS
ncbi:hypothetical protein GCM10009530_56860 [Microbispora corallina]|uniref:Uncharacterized protein n=1 Tax=Microbispora corallina TaxID=83302 RepID=A0ABQ4G8X2_9ACTN|nr:hypothetical protein [Microbispora corallina]GIH43492.1 hypothetical protein Mco01_64920 [Microbispora corallina]